MIAVVGLHGGAWYGARAEDALRRADVLVGAARQHDDLAPMGLAGERVELWGRIDELAELCMARDAAGERVCVLAAGDPGFFGIVRVLAARLGSRALDVHPAPSSISLAFARAGIPWDDALVASAHGRPLDDAVQQVLGAAKAAVLVSPESPPGALGKALLAAGCGPRDVWVVSHLGERDEVVHVTDLDGLASGSFEALSVVVLVAPGSAIRDAASLAWGLPDERYAHGAGMITKAEVRAVALGKLGLPPSGVLWDVGAGSGSVAVEAARLSPGLRVFAVERDAEACGRIRVNARGTGVVVIEGEAPAVLDELPAPDRAFVGGGGPEVLDAVCVRMRPGGQVVATSTILDHATHAANRLGSVVQVGVSRGVPIGPHGALRLAAENPIFIAWGAA